MSNKKQAKITPTCVRQNNIGNRIHRKDLLDDKTIWHNKYWQLNKQNVNEENVVI